MPREVLMNAVAIPAAGTSTTTPLTGLGDVGDILLFADFDYGSGGTSVDAYIQTSVDGGTNWFDIANFRFTTADLKKLLSNSAGGNLTAISTPTDGSLTANTTVDGILGDQYRVKLVVAGTYAASTLSIWMQTRTGLGGSATEALDAASLAALESTDLNAASLAALENISATITGPLGSSADAASVSTVAAVLVVPFSSTAVEAIAATVTDAKGYRHVSVQVAAMGASGVINFEVSNDNATWVACVLTGVANTGNTFPVTSTSAANMFHGPIPARYFRLRQSGIVSGTTSGVVIFSGEPASLASVSLLAIQSGTWNVQPATSGGLTPYRNLDLGLTGQVVKASAGQLYALQVTNQAASARYVKLYNKATAPTEADTPVMTLAIPASTVAVPFNMPAGLAFSAGIALRASNAIADADTTAPTANDVVVNAGYK